jgi:hypothetical protein
MAADKALPKGRNHSNCNLILCLFDFLFAIFKPGCSPYASLVLAMFLLLFFLAAINRALYPILSFAISFGFYCYSFSGIFGSFSINYPTSRHINPK